MSMKLIRGKKVLYILCVTRFMWCHSLDNNWLVALEVLCWAFTRLWWWEIINAHVLSLIIEDFFFVYIDLLNFICSLDPSIFSFFPLKQQCFPLSQRLVFNILLINLLRKSFFITQYSLYNSIYVHEINLSQETTLYSLCNSFYVTSIIGH